MGEEGGKELLDAADLLASAMDTALAGLRRQGADALSIGCVAEVRPLLNRLERLQELRVQFGLVQDGLLELLPPSPPGAEIPGDSASEPEPHRQDRTDQTDINQLRGSVVAAISTGFRATLTRHRQAMFRDDSSGIRVICTVSKDYGVKRPFWYAYHGKWSDFLRPASSGFLALAMVGRDVFIALPSTVVEQNLEKLHRTERPEGGSYWHLHVMEPEPRRFLLGLPKVGQSMDLSPFLQKLG